MDNETKLNFVWIILAVILAAAVMPIWAIVLSPPGLILLGIIVILGIVLIGTKPQE